MGTMAVTVMLLRMIMTPDRHANLVLHVRMKGAILGSVDLALQVSTIRLVHTTRFVQGQKVETEFYFRKREDPPCSRSPQVASRCFQASSFPME